MTPAARYAAAAEIVDAILGGERLEPAIRAWGRAHRFAGSKDRRAIADICYDIARRWWSTAALGGAETGRGRVLGLLRARGVAAETVFTGQGHALAPLSAQEILMPSDPVPYDFPPFLIRELEEMFGSRLPEVNAMLQERAPVDLRVNTAKTSRESLARLLAEAGFDAVPLDDVPTALRLSGSGRGLTDTDLFAEGLFELQDAGSQQIVAFAKPETATTILDYCAGGGGKTLALAAASGRRVVAHDIAPRRMKDIPNRARRAGASVDIIDTADLPERCFDLVYVDAPCTGSGSWRRDPYGKISLTEQRFDDIRHAQAAALRSASRHVAPKGRIAYATCSVLKSENNLQINSFFNEFDFMISERNLSIDFLSDRDGFYANIITNISNL